MEILESIKELISLPFEILSTATGDRPVGYGLLMIMFLIGFITLAYYVLEFVREVIKSMFNFFSNGWESFLDIFKQKKTYHQKIMELNDSWNREKLEIVKAVNEINKKIDEVIATREKKQEIDL